MSQNKSGSSGETHEEREERVARNSEEKKDDKGSSGVARHRGGHESSQEPGKTKDKDGGRTDGEQG
jgi:hypothetical protein